MTSSELRSLPSSLPKFILPEALESDCLTYLEVASPEYLLKAALVLDQFVLYPQLVKVSEEVVEWM